MTTINNSSSASDTTNDWESVILDEVCDIGKILEERIYVYDSMFEMIQNRDSEKRRKFVSAIKTYLSIQFINELENTADLLFKEEFDNFFKNASRDDQIGHTLQIFILHVAIILSVKIRKSLCPDPPNPDDPNAIDMSKVDRLCFSLYENSYLINMFEDLRDGMTLSVPTFVKELNSAYSALLPPCVLTKILKKNNMRDVCFQDDFAREKQQILE